jgi:hypothetical protein
MTPLTFGDGFFLGFCLAFVIGAFYAVHVHGQAANDIERIIGKKKGNP